jgi:hypothetical protein
LKERIMNKRLARALFATLTIAGGAAAALPGSGVANADQSITVCNRYSGGRCVERTTCTIYSDGYWQCSDGTYGDSGGQRGRIGCPGGSAASAFDADWLDGDSMFNSEVAVEC